MSGKKPTAAAKPQRRKTRRPPVALPALLAEGKSYTEIGLLLRADSEAISRWSRLPEIVAEVERIKAAASQVAIDRLRSLQGAAVEALAAVLADGDVRVASARVRAAAEVLDRTGVPKSGKLEVAVSGGFDDFSDAEVEAVADGRA